LDEMNCPAGAGFEASRPGHTERVRLTWQLADVPALKQEENA
jgi:hypothetical protein